MAPTKRGKKSNSAASTTVKPTADNTSSFPACLRLLTPSSVAITIHTLWLAARAEGIGVGWVSILDPARIAEIVEVPRDWTFIGHLCIGYPEEENDTPALQRADWEHRHPAAGSILYR